jgi:hypothetical protein
MPNENLYGLSESEFEELEVFNFYGYEVYIQTYISPPRHPLPN